jgi:serine/threonine protein kinase
MKVIRIAIHSQSDKFTPIVTKSWGRKYQFIAKLESNNTLQLSYIQKVLGKGGFGIVSQVASLHDAQTLVLKEARLDSKDGGVEAKLDVEHEREILTDIHQNGLVWGIQKPPHQFIEITNDQAPIYGFLGPKYDSDYMKTIDSELNITEEFIYHPVSIEDKLIGIHQLLSALKHLEGENILHGDIKPENVLYKLDNNKRPLVHLADFGGSRRANKGEPIILGTYTRAYLAPADKDQIERLKGKLTEKKIEEPIDNEKLRKDLISIRKQADVFAMGCTLYYALALKHPYHYNETEERLKTEGEPDPIPEISEELNTLIKKMIEPNPSARISAPEAFKQFNTILEKEHPFVLATIQGMMNEYNKNN